MFKNTLLLSALLLFSGCAERGYTIKTNVIIQTVTAEAITLLNKEKLSKKQNLFKRMKKAVSKEQEKLKANISPYKKKESKKKKILAITKALNFRQINKVYHKFGTSEIHGHVIYLAQNSQETRLTQTTIYLLPMSRKLNHWYKHYYLKNRNSNNKTTIKYLNQTTLDLEKNFEFYGVPEGRYYIIIESNYPDSMAKDKKVYIAKKIKVGKYKKIMGVFSKKL